MSKDKIKEHLIYSTTDCEKVEAANLDEMANKVETSEDVAAIMKEYEEIIPT